MFGIFNVRTDADSSDWSVTGIVRQGSRRDQKIKKSWRREVELDLQVGPEEIVNREVELG